MNQRRIQTQPQGIVMPEPRRDFFVYNVNALAVAPGATALGAIQIQADSDFELQKLTQFSDIAAAGQTAAGRVLPLVTIQVTDTGTGRTLFSAPVPIPGIFGDGTIPFILQTSKVFTKNSALQIALTNYDAANTYNVRLQLIGSKIFQYG